MGSQLGPNKFSSSLVALRIRILNSSGDTDRLVWGANPIEIAAIVVWKVVVDTAEALFEVDNYVTYVAVQSESAVRAVAQPTS